MSAGSSLRWAAALANLLLAPLLARVWWQGLLLGLGVAALLWLGFRTAPRDSVPATPATADELPPLLIGILPLWQGNIELAVNQSHTAIGQLMLRFSSIHQRLAETVELASHTDNRTVLQHIRSAKQELDSIPHALESLTGAHDDLLQKIATLQGLNGELKQISRGIIELAHQGRQTADAPDNEPLSKQIDQIGLALQATLEAARQLHDEEAGQVEHTRNVIRRVLADFRQGASGMSQAISTLENVNRGVEEEIHDIMVQLQFQDRVSQILEHVRQDIDKLQHQLQQQAPLPDLASWQDQLFATYTTQEQRQLHPRAPADPGSKSVEFF